MKTPGTNLRSVLLLLLAVLSANAAADQVTNTKELALLPDYCRGTQPIRDISKDPRPVEEYVKIYGDTFLLLHHYCWALNTENNALRLRDAYLRTSKLASSLVDYIYFLDRAPDSFPLLPDVYVSRARVLFALKRDAEGINDLNKAIQLKPDYPLPYVRLSEYYQDKGDKTNAVKILEQGIDHCEQAKLLIRRLEKLGKTYVGVPGHARKKEAVADAPASKDDAANPGAATPAAPAEPSAPDTRTEAEKKANPYCRFCP